ncbi:SHOCT domain-containing protein [Pseudarthrobacter oxydans]|uniref:SHOCT domain-containing protein n=1 Tax=Pseudarthrobacter oxydans TaxID=1671 RepID=UPI00381C6F91
MTNATEPFRAPLGIALGVLAITLLIALAVKSSSRRQAAELASTEARKGGPRAMLRMMRRKRSVAAELALLAELHAKGALSDEEFSAAKLRTLGD